ncbi:MAG: radical SAM family heme chaperone HemW [Clostridia bacterium]|nr:radical SAM family heme chaperone HemW [Clostridia bacterium]
MSTLGIYIHVPFCLRKCAYCDFYSGPSEAEEREAYVSALIGHIKDERQKLNGRIVDTVFFGGGTPSLLTPNQFYRILETVAENGTLSPDAEISFEANPATLTREGLSEFRQAGANRISIGLQSASDEELCILGRIHTVSEFEQTFRDARAVGFDNVNVDLMYGIPAQTERSFAHSLRFVTALAPEHISAYCLTLEAGTPLAKQAKKYIFPDEDTVADLYDCLCLTLKDASYEHYEISNFAKPKYRCRHNLKYWKRQEYLGFGPSAHSFFDNRRFYFPADRSAYRSPATRQAIPEDEGSDMTDAAEAIMLALRLSDGLDTAAFRETYGIDFEASYGKKILPYIQNGYLRPTERGYAFTDRGMFVSNYILAEIL